MQRLGLTSFLFLWVWAGAGCAVPMGARPPQVLDPGQWSAGMYIGGTFGSEKLPDAIPLELMANYGFTARVGVFSPCEAGVDLGFVRQGLSARCAAIGAGSRNGVFLAPSAGVAYKPMRGAEVHGGLDFGVRTPSVQPFLNVSASYGRHWYFTPSEEPRHIEQSKYDFNVRPEWRLTSTAGFVTRVPNDGDGPASVVLGVSPYWILEGTDDVDSVPDGVTWSVGGQF